MTMSNERWQRVFSPISSNTYATIMKNGIKICQKTLCLVISASKFLVKHTVEGSSVCDVASKVAEVIVAAWTVQAVVNVVELFLQIIVVL